MLSHSNQLTEQQLDLAIHIEKLALHTWPAVNALPVDSWIFRASGGITMRANSVWTAAGEFIPDGDWLEKAVQFYHSQGLPVRFHVSDASPKLLDSTLEKLGYSKEAPCFVMIASTDEVIYNTTASQMYNLQLTISPDHDEQWLSNFLKMEEFGEERRNFYRKLFADIQPAKGFFTLELDGVCAAVGTVIVEESWAGFINLAVNPAMRGKGIGKRLVNELAKWSQLNGANQLYLQVMVTNKPALKLYTSAGYTPLFQYHYRSKNI